MARLELRPFARDDIDDAAALLVRRHATHRAAEPSLPAASERADVAQAEIEELLPADASGAFATRDGTAVGFMLGRHRHAASWGANVWVEAAGRGIV